MRCTAIHLAAAFGEKSTKVCGILIEGVLSRRLCIWVKVSCNLATIVFAIIRIDNTLY